MSTEKGLNTALRVAADHGWAPLPLLPFTKIPVNKGLFDKPPHTPEEINAAWEKAIRTIRRDARISPEFHTSPPNIGVLLGASKLFMVDADTPNEVAAWKALCDQHGFDPGEPMVRSPGTRGTDGAMKHIDGGHWYFTQPDDLAITSGKINIKIGVETNGEKATVYGGRHLGVIPPSVRDTGAYEYTSSGVQQLPPFMYDQISLYLFGLAKKSTGSVSGSDPLFGTSEYRASESEWAWEDRTSWLDVLPEGWVETHEERDGHVVYAHPGASSSRSSVAHPTGCEHFPNGNAPSPMTFFSIGAGTFLDELSDSESSSSQISATKLRLFALKNFDGDMGQARSHLGITSSRPEVPTTPVSASPVLPAAAVSDSPEPPIAEVVAETPSMEPVQSAPPTEPEENNPFAVLAFQPANPHPASGNPTENPDSAAVMPPPPVTSAVRVLVTADMERIRKQSFVSTYVAEPLPRGLMDDSEVLSKELAQGVLLSMTGKKRSRIIPQDEAAELAPINVPPDSDSSNPVVETPAAEPVVETPVEEPVVETPVETPAEEILAAEPVVETPAEDVPIAEPVTETPVETPVAETPDVESTPENSVEETPGSDAEVVLPPPPKKATRSRKKPVEPEPEDVRELVTEPPPPWNPVPIYETVLSILKATARDLIPDELAQLSRVEAGASSFAHRKLVMGSGTHHLLTTDVSAALGISSSRTRSILRAMLPGLEDQHGLIIRERLIKEDPFQFGSRSPHPDDVAWAVFRNPDAELPAETASSSSMPTAPPTTTGEVEKDASSDQSPGGTEHTILPRYDASEPVVYAPTVGEDPWFGINEVLSHPGPLKFIGLDVETSGLEWDCVLRTVQFGTPTHAVVLDVESDPAHADAAKEILSRPELRFTAHNSAFDVLVLARNGFCDINDIMTRMTDTLILTVLFDPPSKIGSMLGGDVKYDLKSVSDEILGTSFSPGAKKKLQASWRKQGWTVNAATPETRGWAQCDVHDLEFSAYSAADVIDGSSLAERLYPFVVAALGDSVFDREHRLLELCMEMQNRGYLVDRDRAQKLLTEERIRVAELDEKLLALGVTNPSQNKHVAECIEAEGKIKLPVTATGAKSVDKLTLSGLTKSNIAPLLLKRRGIEKGASTYLSNWLDLSKSDGRLHPFINSLKATTGRFSMDRPSLQNVPASLRGYILAHPGTAMITADFSSVEVRIGAGFSGDEQLTQDFIDYDADPKDPKETADPYQKVAIAAYHPGDLDILLSDLPKQERQRAKSILLGRMYGRGASGLAIQESITESEAQAILELIDQRYPSLGKFSQGIAQQVKCGATRIKLPGGRTVAVDPTWARKAVNYLIQGTGRELMVDAGFRLVDAGFRDNLWMSVHDEWLVCVPEEEANEAALRMEQAMNTMFMGVPITAKADILDSRWGKEGRAPGKPKLVFDDEAEARKIAEELSNTAE